MFAGKARAFPGKTPFRCLVRKHQTRLEMTARGKHSGLLQTFVNYRCKIFYNIGLWTRCCKIFFFYNLRMLIISQSYGKPFQPSLTFASKAGASLSKITFRCYPLGWALGLIHNHQTRLEMPARDKHSSLIQTFVNYGSKKTYSMGSWNQYYKTFFFCNL